MSDKRGIDTPHERQFRDHGHMDVVTLGDFTLGRGVFEPGVAMVQRRQADRRHRLLPGPPHRLVPLGTNDHHVRQR